MFEHYVQAHAGNPRWRRATGIAAVISGCTTAGLLVGVWVHEKLAIERVDPPQHAVLVVQMLMEENAMPPPPPPPPPAGGEAEEDEAPDSTDTPTEISSPVPEEEIPLELEQPTRNPERRAPSPAALPQRSTSQGVPGGIPGGIPGGDPLRGVPGGVGVPGMPGVLGGRGAPGAVATKREPTRSDAVAKQPLKTVKRNALHAPDCDAKKLASTRAAMFSRRGGHTKVAFCVDEAGKTVDLRTTTKFPGDPEVDRICLDTVSKWRFQPFLVDGRPIKTCSSVDFAIEFE